jgi:hypothetical protein
MDSLVFSLRYWSIVFRGSCYSVRRLSKLKLMWLKASLARGKALGSRLLDMGNDYIILVMDNVLMLECLTKIMQSSKNGEVLCEVTHAVHVALDFIFHL